MDTDVRKISKSGSLDHENSRGSSRHWDKRKFEHFHVYCWSLKDTAWIRAMDWRIVVTLGTIVVILSAPYMFIDAWAMARTRCHVKRIMYFKEFVSSVIQFIWIFGSVIWAAGECYDLRNSADYLDVYESCLKVAKWFLFIANTIGSMLWLIIIVFNIIPFPKWYNSILDDWYTVYRRKPEDTIDKPAYISHDTHSSELEALAIQEGGCEVAIVQGRDDIVGIPRMVPGFMRVPAGKLNYKTGRISDKATWQYTSGLFSYREMELLLLYVWIFKDLGWALQVVGDTGRNIVMVFGSLALILGVTCALWVTIYSKQLSEKIYAFGVFLWVSGDMLWCFGEFCRDEDTYADNFPDIESNVNFILPPIFTKPKDLPPGSWLTRYIGSWILIADDVMLTAYYIYSITKMGIKYYKRKQSMPLINK